MWVPGSASYHAPNIIEKFIKKIHFLFLKYMNFSSIWHCPRQSRFCNRKKKNACDLISKLGAELEQYWKRIVVFSFMRKCSCYRLSTNHHFSWDIPHNPVLLRTNIANDLMLHVHCISSPYCSNASYFAQCLLPFLWRALVWNWIRHKGCTSSDFWQLLQVLRLLFPV